MNKLTFFSIFFYTLSYPFQPAACTYPCEDYHKVIKGFNSTFMKSEFKNISLKVANDGYSLLMWSAKCGNINAVRFLINEGANVNEVFNYEFTVLINAAQYGNEEIVSLLLAAGADANGSKLIKRTALIGAVGGADWNGPGNKNIVKLLLAGGADINGVDEYGHTALGVATVQGDVEMVNILLAAGAEVDKVGVASQHLKDKHSYLYDTTPLISAARHRRKDVLEALLAAGADVNGVDEYGNTALGEAALNRRKDLVDILIAAGADVDRPNYKGITPLMQACIAPGFNETDEVNAVAVINTLLDLGADVNKSDEQYYDAVLVHALSYAYPSPVVVKVLLARGAQVDSRVLSAVPNNGKFNDIFAKYRR